MNISLVEESVIAMLSGLAGAGITYDLTPDMESEVARWCLIVAIGLFVTGLVFLIMRAAGRLPRWAARDALRDTSHLVPDDDPWPWWDDHRP